MSENAEGFCEVRSDLVDQPGFPFALSSEWLGHGNLFILAVGPFLQHYLADRLMTVTIQSIQNLFPCAFDSVLVPFDPL